MPTDLTLKTLNLVHRTILKFTNGKVGWKAGGMPVVDLTTVGRRSGQPRTTMLTSPFREGSTIVVIASRGGDDHHPAWYLNLQDRPEVTVKVEGQAPQLMRAITADTQERARLWPLITADHANYADYQRRTKREIPVVLLQPITE